MVRTPLVSYFVTFSSLLQDRNAAQAGFCANPRKTAMQIVVKLFSV
jgi:hypothetical protein